MLDAPTKAAEADTVIDPVTLEIIAHELQSIPDEVEADLTRTAFSPLIYEYKDYAVGLVDAQGHAIALAKQGLPLFLASLIKVAVHECVQIHGQDGIRQGDVFITNYPETIGQHLNNVVMYTPIFSNEAQPTLVAFMSIIAHWIDIGGRYPGSCSGTDTTDIFQEGLQLRSIKLCRSGSLVPDVLRIIEDNSRFPVAVRGDLDAQVAGCLKGALRFADLLQKYSTRTLFAGIERIWEATAEAARQSVAEIPDGCYEMTSFLDDDGINLGRRIPIHIKVEIRGSRFIVDYSGIAEQMAGPLNSGYHGGGETCARIALKYLTCPDAAPNESSFAPLEIILPRGKFLNAGPRAPLGRYSTPLPTVIDTIIGALADAVPDRVAAGHHANFGSHRFSGMGRSGDYFSFLDSMHGGWGASQENDGAGPFKTSGHGDNRDIPVEVQEALYPVLIEHYRWIPDSGGAGRRRGGLALEKAYRLLAPLTAMIAFERTACPAWGLFGGHPGRTGHVELIKAGGAPERMTKRSHIPLDVDDRLVLYSSGGGGYGPPSEREPERILADLRDGYVSAEAASSIYRVATRSDGSLDAERTAELRARLKDAGARNTREGDDA